MDIRKALGVLFAIVSLSLLSVSSFAQTHKKVSKAHHHKAIHHAPVPPTNVPERLRLSFMSLIPFPDMELHSTNTPSTTLKKLQKKNGLLVLFFSHACPYSDTIEKDVMELMNFTSKKEIGMVLINSNDISEDNGGQDDPAHMQDIAHRRRYSVPYVTDMDAQMANTFGATTNAQAFLFNKDGKLFYQGCIEDSLAGNAKFYVRDAIDSMMKGRPMMPPMRRAYGCRIRNNRLLAQ